MLIGVLLPVIIPYAIPALMPTWRWWLGVTCIFGGLLTGLWVQEWMVSYDPDFHGSLGDALGSALLVIVTIEFAIGAIVRACTLLLAAYGLPLKYTWGIGVAGFAITPAFFLVLVWWQEARQPSEACKKATFHVTVGGAAFSISATSTMNIFLGGRYDRNAYYLDQSWSLRQFCKLSNGGRRHVTAANIWFRLRNFGMPTPAMCTGEVAEWANTYCAAHAAARRGEADKVDFPDDIYVFAPEKTHLNEFLGSRSTYQDSIGTAPKPDEFYVTADTTPRAEPLTFRCRTIQSGIWCDTFYAWRDGAYLGYRFQSSRNDLVARGSRIDMETRKFLAGFEAR